MLVEDAGYFMIHIGIFVPQRREHAKSVAEIPKIIITAQSHDFFLLSLVSSQKALT